MSVSIHLHVETEEEGEAGILASRSLQPVETTVWNYCKACLQNVAPKLIISHEGEKQVNFKLNKKAIMTGKYFLNNKPNTLSWFSFYSFMVLLDTKCAYIQYTHAHR